MSHEKIILFDVDGTLTESGQDLEKEMADNLIRLKSDGFTLGIVGGGRFEKIVQQLGEAMPMITHFFTECGCVYHVRQDDKINNVYTRNIRTHGVWPMVNELIKIALGFLSLVDYPVTGHFIDLRSGIVYISMIGMVATTEERQFFLEQNKKNGYIDQLLSLLKEQCRIMGMGNKIDIVRGGSVGITIYPTEWDKEQVVDTLLAREIYYFGDKYEKDGNDYRLLNHPRILGYKTDSPEMTCRILQQFFFK